MNLEESKRKAAEIKRRIDPKLFYCQELEGNLRKSGGWSDGLKCQISGGDYIDFTMRRYGINFKEAAKKLFTSAGVANTPPPVADPAVGYAEAAKAAARIWAKAAQINGQAEHPYLIKKRVQAHSVRVLDDALVVPLFNSDGELSTLQRIYPDGSKRLLSGGKKSGSFFLVGEVATLAAETSEADPVAVYFSFLAAMAAMIGKYRYLQVGDTRYNARLFTAVVGASSRARKGTSVQPVKRIIKKAEEMFEKAEKNHLFSSLPIIDGGLSSAEGLIFAVRDEADETKGKDEMPLWAGVEDKRLFVVEEELAQVFKVVQREGNTLSPVLRKMWDYNQTLAPLTKNNRLKATDPHINILGHITQHELKSLVTSTDIFNGLLNRFLWVCVRRTKKLAFPKPMDDSKVLDISIRLAGTLKKFYGAGEATETLISKEARAYWEIQYPIISSDRHGIIGAATARDEAYVLRLALLLSMLDDSDKINKPHIEAAIAAVNYSIASAEYIFTAPGDETPDAQKLLVALERGRMTQTEINKLFSGHKTRSQLIGYASARRCRNGQSGQGWWSRYHSGMIGHSAPVQLPNHLELSPGSDYRCRSL